MRVNRAPMGASAAKAAFRGLARYGVGRGAGYEASVKPAVWGTRQRPAEKFRPRRYLGWACGSKRKGQLPPVQACVPLRLTVRGLGYSLIRGE
jgi:hypothetical protein